MRRSHDVNAKATKAEQISQSGKIKNNSPAQSMAFTQPLATPGQLYADPMVTVF